MTRDDQRTQNLLELTALPTAAGREDRVIQWVERWAEKTAGVHLERDRFGNLILSRTDLAGASERPASDRPMNDQPRASGEVGESVGGDDRRQRSSPPIVFAAHIDHPAFVITQVLDERTVRADFRGGVADAYFENAAVLLHHAGRSPRRGVVAALEPVDETTDSLARDKRVRVRLAQAGEAGVGDVMTWDLPPSWIDEHGRLHAPACDDLAGVGAALASFETLLRQDAASEDQAAAPTPAATYDPRAAAAGESRDVRVLLTRAEEVGLVGATAACHSGIIPPGSRLVALENSRSFADSPIGGGPVVRVGDKTSTFDPELTYRLGKVAQRLARRDPDWRWQRRLMPGGTCEASAYQALGHTAACLCLPLGNYHNMNEKTRRIDAEMIALTDYHALVRLLVEIGSTLDQPDPETSTVSLRQRLDHIYTQRKHLLTARDQDTGRT